MDASLPEFVLLFVIGLIVLGPERLAQVARKLGQFVGYARRMSRNLQTQLEDELELKRIKDSLPQRVDLKEQLGLGDIEKDLKSLADDVEGKKKPAATPTPIPPPPDKPPVSTEPDDEGTEHRDVDWDEAAEAADDDYVPIAATPEVEVEVEAEVEVEVEVGDEDAEPAPPRKTGDTDAR